MTFQPLSKKSIAQKLFANREQKIERLQNVNNQRLWYTLDDDEPKLERGVHVRMELELFRELRRIGDLKGWDLSSTIRRLCRQGLQEKEEDKEEKPNEHNVLSNLWNKNR